MKRMFQLFTLLLAGQLVQADTPKAIKKPVTGTYSVSTCTNEISENKQVLLLKIKEDHTFLFVDKTNPEKLKNVEGKWELQNNTIHLKDYQSTYAIPKNWKVDSEYPCVRSRLGLNFTRLCSK